MNRSSLHLLLLLSDRDKKSPRYKTRHSDAAFTSGLEDQYFIFLSLRDRQSARQHFPRCPFFDCSVRGQSIDPNVRLMEGRDRKSKLFRRKEGRRFLGLSNLSLASVPPSFHTEPSTFWESIRSDLSLERLTQTHSLVKKIFLFKRNSSHIYLSGSLDL